MQRITVTNTHSTIAGSSLQRNENSCEHCTAAYGHTQFCPLLNRNIAEVRSAINGALNIPDAHELHALGILWEDEGEEARRTR